MNLKIKMRDVFIIVAVLAGFFFSGTSFSADGGPKETVILFKVTENGFLDEAGQELSGTLEIPKASHIKLVFEYADRSGDVHEFGLLKDSDEEVYSDAISEKNMRTEIVFFSGEAGAHFEVYCILGCSAMDKLTDLILAGV